MEKKFDQNAYKAEFNKTNYHRIELRIPKGKKAEWKAKAKAEGLSLTEWITKQIEEK
jgi:predicted HicB family RNase H-like nuclease